MIVGAKSELIERIDATRARLIQLARFRLAMLARRLHEQAIGRAAALLHGNLGRRMQRVDDAGERLRSAMRMRFAGLERQRRALEEKLRYYDLRPRLRRDRERMNAASARLATLAQSLLTQKRQRFEMLSTKLEQLNPRKVLERGYAIVLDERGQIVKEAANAQVAAEIRVLFARDSVKARVTESPERNSAE
jgi:exodeoxyribonuclease VII large subunit